MKKPRTYVVYCIKDHKRTFRIFKKRRVKRFYKKHYHPEVDRIIDEPVSWKSRKR